MITLRFDMRAPDGSAPATELYDAAIEMCAWAETRGAIVAVLSEHHAAQDGHLPSPLILASAIAARTERLAILLAAVILPLWDPVRLAEEIAVLDIISKGRVWYAFGIGHRPEEYEHFGVDTGQRGRLADENLGAASATSQGRARDSTKVAASMSPRRVQPGRSADHDRGRQPGRCQTGGRHGLGFISQVPSADLKEFYESECRANRHEPGMTQFPDVALADDGLRRR